MILLFTLFLAQTSFAQHIVEGIVHDINNDPVAGCMVREVGTGNGVMANLEGEFSITTTKNEAELLFQFVGMPQKTVEIISDTILNVVLDDFEKYQWLAVGGLYDPINSIYGFTIGNGYNEEPLFHFEDFQDDYKVRLAGYTDFSNDYKLNFKIAKLYLGRHFYDSTIELDRTNFQSLAFNKNEIDGSIIFVIPRFKAIQVNAGFQDVNEKENFGVGLGVPFLIRIKNVYGGANVGYYQDYWTYDAYLQAAIIDRKLSLRSEYERIDEFDFLNIGVNYTFRR